MFKPAAYPAVAILALSPLLGVWPGFFLPSFLFLVCMSQQFHAWSHMKKSELPGVVVALQVRARARSASVRFLRERRQAQPGERARVHMALPAPMAPPPPAPPNITSCPPRPPPRPAPFYHKPQDAGVLIGRREHGAHHKPNFEGNYCIVSGWWNAPLDNAGFFRWLEKVVLARTGVEPRCWYPPEHGWEELARPEPKA